MFLIPKILIEKEFLLFFPQKVLLSSSVIFLPLYFGRYVSHQTEITYYLLTYVHMAL